MMISNAKITNTIYIHRVALGDGIGFENSEESEVISKILYSPKLEDLSCFCKFMAASLLRHC
jgi:hypothetical protein